MNFYFEKDGEVQKVSITIAEIDEPPYGLGVRHLPRWSRYELQLAKITYPFGSCIVVSYAAAKARMRRRMKKIGAKRICNPRRFDKQRAAELDERRKIGNLFTIIANSRIVGRKPGGEIEHVITNSHSDVQKMTMHISAKGNGSIDVKYLPYMGE